ncbi:MAG: ATP-dependent zinc protease [Planctomycetes bacterium]|nr:ATP-dependent zinc protease [Planctomycetota bacterium]
MIEPEKPRVIGWKEWVGFPDWGRYRVRAKIDTGARTSALHVENVERIGDGRVRFDVVTREKPRKVTHRVTARLVRTTRVKPSSGELQERLVIETRVQVGPIDRTIEVSLVERTGMLCRMLLGRRALTRMGVNVDPSRRYLMTAARSRSRTRDEEEQA